MQALPIHADPTGGWGFRDSNSVGLDGTQASVILAIPLMLILTYSHG